MLGHRLRRAVAGSGPYVPTGILTWNPADKAANIVLQDSDLTINNVTTSLASARSVQARSKVGGSGKRYVVWKTSDDITTTKEDVQFGIARSNKTLTSGLGADAFLSTGHYKPGFDNTSGTIKWAFATTNHINLTILQNQENALAVDFDTGKVWIGLNGIWYGASGLVGDPEAGTNPWITATQIEANDWYLIGLVRNSRHLTLIDFPSVSSFARPASFLYWDE